ncbi:MAG: undecaprenyl-diphosphate phosphatase [Pseudobdellovibrionaceae bacterium]
MDILQTIIFGLVEGLTEYLPISSTGHLVIASSLMGISEDVFVKNFEVIIQFGAILAVLAAYPERFRWNFLFYKKIAFAFIPTAIIGFVLKNKVDDWLGSIHIVAWSLIIGGFVLMACDKVFAPLQTAGRKVEDLTIKDCLLLGLFQSLAIVPGVSRSGATIFGGLILGMNKKEAAEFSFFLAVPTIAAAAGYKILRLFMPHAGTEHLPAWGQQPHPILFLLLGSVISFFVAWVAIRFFISILSKYGLKYFGWYRVVLGSVLLLYF